MRVPTPGSAGAQVDLRIFLIHTVSFQLGLLNYHRKAESLSGLGHSFPVAKPCPPVKRALSLPSVF